jgi:tRNA(Ile)-lysidine synthase TilS/MesJ
MKSRASISAHIERHGLAFADDPSNRSARFLRVRVRSEVLPLLEQLSPRIREHLAELADAVVSSNAAQARGTPDDRPDPRLESKRALADLARLSLLERGSKPNARVSLKGGVVLSVGGAQALKNAPPRNTGARTRFSTKKKDSGP